MVASAHVRSSAVSKGRRESTSATGKLTCGSAAGDAMVLF
jgi:hypothetical protein